ncbi:MAG: VWA domain-containing protein [Gammaproteobacteria bacterium]|nr:VWA domain-containing protein [Gammaproteobacteria bacterium]
MYALVMPVWAELGQEEISEQDIAEAVIDPVLDEISPQMEEMTFDTMDSVMTDQATESSAELADTDISETAISEIEVDIPEVSGVKGSPLIKDVVLVLDNSGSMKKNDPQFLTKHAVTEFINNLDESTRAAIIIFDQDVHSAVPLTDISSTSRQGLLDSLSQINYKGLYTNSPAAIESAIYDLKNNGREEARKVIVFMTDGIVDTGNADRDLEKTKWLKEDLAADAADAGIRIFGIAFTENADFELIQSLAQKTEGEYYRALLADDLQNVFSKLNTLINKPDEPEIIEEPQPRIIEKIVERVVEAKPEPIIIEVPAAQPQPADESERKRSMLILVALAVLILAVIAMVLMLLRGSKSKSLDEETAQEAYLNDIHGITKQATFALGNKPTMLGRVAGKDTEFLNYYVIPETTIGRRHSLIEYKDFSYWIVDQGSINGTFVNDKPVTTEVRLKHGDIIRLHKIEFEFVIPEMVDSGMTVIASTAIPGKGITAKDEETLTPGSKPSAVNYDELDDDDDLPEPDFDITGEHGSVDSDIDEDTVMKGDVPTAEGPDGSDETIMLYDDDDDDDITR